MPDRWTEDRDRQWRERNWRSEAYGRAPEGDRGRGGERRSFGEADEHAARREGRDRDRVFGEEDTGGAYNTRNQPRPGGGGYGAGGSYGGGESYGRGAGGGRDDEDRGGGGDRWTYGGRGGSQDYGRRPAWQDRDYQGVSPAMRKGEYEADRGRGGMRFEQQDYTSGGRYYGDDARERIYRQEYGQGGVEYGAVPGGYESGYRDYRPDLAFGDDRRFEQRYEREMQRPASGGTGGYDYERGYGDGGRGDMHRGREPYRGDDDRGRGGGAGDFLQRAGERLTSWFGNAVGEVRRDLGPEGAGPRRYASDFGREPRWDVGGHRGRGPKDYKRPDDRISDEVHQRLTDDPWLDASQISVAVSAGEVTLSGTVENRESRRRAERLVEDLSGVTHVQNDLRVAQTGSLTSPGRGFGDSVLEAQMKREQATGANGATDGGTTSTEDSAATRTTTRRT